MILLNEKNKEVKIGTMFGEDRVVGFASQPPGTEGSGIVALVSPSGENYDAPAAKYKLRVVEKRKNARDKQQ
jgi:hypothetical protein